MDKHLNEQEISRGLQIVIEEETVHLNEKSYLGASEDNWIGRFCRRNVCTATYTVQQGKPKVHCKSSILLTAKTLALIKLSSLMRLLPRERPYKLAEKKHLRG
jgi:hypothetical protein